MFCTMYRWLISRSMDSPGALSPRTAGHVARCEACRNYHRRCLELTDLLGAQAREQRGAVSEDLHARILLRCGAGAVAAPPRPLPRMASRRVRVGLAAAAVSAIVLAAWLLRPAASPRPEDVAPKPTPSPHRVDPGDQDMPLDYLLWPAIALAEANSAFDRSLDIEFEQIRQSGRAAAEFVLARMPIDIDLP